MFLERYIDLCEEHNFAPSSKEASKNFGIPLSSLGHYLTGRMPSIEKLIKIAKYFNVSTDYLLGVSDTRNCSNDILDVSHLNSSQIKEVQRYINFIVQESK